MATMQHLATIEFLGYMFKTWNLWGLFQGSGFNQELIATQVCFFTSPLLLLIQDNCLKQSDNIKAARSFSLVDLWYPRSNKIARFNFNTSPAQCLGLWLCCAVPKYGDRAAAINNHEIKVVFRIT